MSLGPLIIRADAVECNRIKDVIYVIIHGARVMIISSNKINEKLGEHLIRAQFLSSFLFPFFTSNFSQTTCRDRMFTVPHTRPLQI